MLGACSAKRVIRTLGIFVVARHALGFCLFAVMVEIFAVWKFD